MKEEKTLVSWWLCVNKNGSERIFTTKPFRRLREKFMSEWPDDLVDVWRVWEDINSLFPRVCPGRELEKGTIEYLIGRKLTWDDEPVEIRHVEIK